MEQILDKTLQNETQTKLDDEENNEDLTELHKFSFPISKLQVDIQIQKLQPRLQLNFSFQQGINGITSSNINKLIDTGYHTVGSVAHAMKKDLTNIKGIPDFKAEKLQEAAGRFGKLVRHES